MLAAGADAAVSEFDGLATLPTALAAAGAPAPDEASPDDVDLLPLLEGKTGKLGREALFWRVAGNGRKGDKFAVRKGDWKLVKATDENPTVLIDLAADPGELTDLSAARPEKVEELQALWDRWNAAMKPPLGRRQGDARNGAPSSNAPALRP